MSIFQQNGICPALLVGVEELLGNQNFITPVGGIQALLDPENTKGVTIEQIGAGEGHEKKVRVMYKQRAIPSAVRTAKSCDTGSEKPRFETVQDVTLSNEIAIKVNEATVRRLCNAYSALQAVPIASRDTDGKALNSKLIMKEITDEILSDLDSLRQVLNTNFLTAVGLNFGHFQGGATVKQYNMIKSEDNAIVLTGFNKMKQDLKKINAGVKPILFGGGNLDLAVMAAGFGCCNNAGQDLSMLGKDAGFKFYEDYSNMATYLGDANAFGMLMPKAAQLITYNKYVGDFAMPIGTMFRGTLPDPQLPGVKYDIRIMPNECGEYWDLFINLDYDFYFAPLNIYASGDRLAGYNGILRGEAIAI